MIARIISIGVMFMVISVLSGQGILTSRTCAADNIEKVKLGEQHDYQQDPLFEISESGEYKKIYGVNGEIKAEGRFVNGRREGTFTNYSNGVSFTRNYKNNRLLDSNGDLFNGIDRVYYENGKLNLEASYVKGLKDGLMRIFDRERKLRKEMSFLRGKLHGAIKWYDADGKLKKEIDYERGANNGVKKIFDHDGNVKKILKICEECEDDDQHGLINYQLRAPQQFDSTGNPLDGIFRDYYEDGRLKSEASYVDGHKEGLMKIFDREGKLEKEMSFLRGNLNGAFKYYDTDGKLIKVIDYVMGRKNGFVKIFDREGKVIKEIEFRRDRKVKKESPAK